jgi:hypothetical protein
MGGLVYQDGEPVGPKWVWKANGAGETQVEGKKGEYSDAFKRAAVMWGIGRYLYDLPNVWVNLDQYGKFEPPNLPDWAIPNAIVKVSKQTKDTVFSQSIECLTANDVNGLREIWSEYKDDDPSVRNMLWYMFNSQQRDQMKKLLED